MKTRIIPYTLHFKQPAGTSRGIYTLRKVWYVVMEHNGRTGVGECAPLPNLSCDDVPHYEEVLLQACRLMEQCAEIPYNQLLPYPSILFGLETALLHLKSGSVRLFNTPFSQGSEGIRINGLIWMGSFEEMNQRIAQKLSDGFTCIKVKIGAIDFEHEVQLLQSIRQHYSPETVELRVDANGAFTPAEAPKKLEQLATLKLHSIEQPIRAGQWNNMAQLCAATPLPIALDEELIGVNDTSEKALLLDTIRPQYIILKPSLHGGIRGSEEWIKLATERGIGYWITSALESNIGLNAIAQWCATLSPQMPQGLGTGLLFEDNIDYPLTIQGERLYMTHQPEPDFEALFAHKPQLL